MKKSLLAIALFGAAIVGASCSGKTAAEQSSDASTQPKVLVAYFSATGTTENAAKHIADLVSADLYQINPETPYTAEDLDWRNDRSRSSIEMSDSTSRPPIVADSLNLEPYDVVFIGYPIWWDLAPRLVNTFIEANSELLAGKTVIPFATSGSSVIRNSANNLKRLYPKLKWRDGLLLNGNLNDFDDAIVSAAQI